MDIKERIAQEIDKWLYVNHVDDIQISEHNVSVAFAEAILSLTYSCKECRGKGKLAASYVDMEMDVITLCPTCKGTGKGSPILAALARNQELPKPPQEQPTYETLGYHLAYREAQKEMIEQGWRKTI